MENSSPAPVQPNVAYFSDGNILRDLGKIEGKLESLEKRVDKHDGLGKEISDLKEWRAWIKGGAAAVGVASGSIGPLVLKYIFHVI